MAASKCVRKASASPRPQSVRLSHFVGSFHRYNTYADLVSLHPLFQFALCLTGAEYQNGFCITDARNYLIVLIRKMPHVISFPRTICGTSCGASFVVATWSFGPRPSRRTTRSRAPTASASSSPANHGRLFSQGVQAHQNLAHFLASPLIFCDLP
jgi:hypothetical protein